MVLRKPRTTLLTPPLTQVTTETFTEFSQGSEALGRELCEGAGQGQPGRAHFGAAGLPALSGGQIGILVSISNLLK